MSETDAFTIEELEKIVLPDLSIEGHSILVFLIDKLLLVNDHFFEEFDFIGQTKSDIEQTLFINKKDFEELFNLFEKMLPGDATEVSLIIPDKEGCPAPVDIHVSRIENDDDGPLFFCKFSPKIIERKFDRDDIFEENEDTFKIIADKSQNGIMLFSGSFDLLYANPSAIAMWGFEDYSELKNGGFINSILPEDLSRLDFLIKGLHDLNKFPSEFTVRIIRKEGAIHHLSALTEIAYIKGKKCGLASFIDITKQIEAESALRSSEENFRLHFENVTDVLYSVDKELRITSVSPSVEKITGHKQSELVGRNFTELNFLSPISLGDAYDDAVKVLSGDTIKEAEYEFISKDGPIIIASVTGSPLYKDGEIVEIVAVARDVTKRKKIEDAIKLKAEIEGLISQISSDFVNCDIDKVDERIVKAFERLGEFTKLDYCANAVIDEDNIIHIKNEWYSNDEGPFSTLFKDVSMSNFMFMEKAFLKTQSIAVTSLDDFPAYALEEKKFYKDSGLNSCLFIPLTFDEKIQGVIGFGRTGEGEPFNEEVISILKIVGEVIINALSRQSAEIKLRESEERYRVHFENVSDVIYSLDNQLRLSFISPSIEKLIGYSPEELIGKTLSEADILEEESLKNGFFDWITINQGTDITKAERILKTKNGSRKIVEISSVPVMKDGEFIASISAARDVTDKKIAEYELTKAEELFRTAAELTSDVIFEFDIETNRLKWHGDVDSMLGYEPGEFPTDLFEVNKSVHREDRKEYLSAIYISFMKRSSFNHELRLRKKDGSYIYIHSSGKILTDNRGMAKRWIGVFSDITESKKSEAALKESERTYRLLTEGISDVIWSTDINMNMTYVSPSVFKLRGFTPEEVYKQSIKEMFTPESFEKLMSLYSDLFAYQNSQESPGHTDPLRSWTGEFEYYKKDGSTIWTELKASFIYDKDGKIIGTQGITRDISKRKKYDEAIRQSEEKYRALFETSPEMVTIVGFNGKIIDVNGKIEEFNQLPKNEIIGRPYTEIGNIHKDDMQEAVQQFMDILAGKEAKPVTYRFFRNDGSMRWVESYTSVLNKEGKPNAIQVISRDVTFKKEADESLKKSEKMFKTAASIASDLIYELDIETMKMKWFGDIDGITGYEPGGFPRDLKGNNAHIHRDDRQRVLNSVAEGIDKGVPFYEEYRIRKKDGDFIHVSSRGKPIYDDNNELKTWIGVNTDITQKVREEKRKVGMEEHLRRAQKLESLSVLSAGMAHKFNNLLSVIVGNAEILEIDYGNIDKISSGISNITEAAKSASNQVNQLLAFSRGQNLRGAPVNINEEIIEISSLADTMAKMNVIVETFPDAKKPIVSGDGPMIKGALTNLYLNALDAMDAEGILTLKTENITIDEEESHLYLPEITPGEFIKISVSDTGKGIEADEMANIFDPFYSGKSFGQTSGLGLSMVYGCVKSHRGAVKVESKPGKGACFNLYFPIYDEKEKVFKKSLVNKPTKNKNIMLVDDEKMVLDITTRMLKTMDYNVIAFQDAKKAFEYYSGHYEEISLVILDSVMPTMTGSELLQKLKKINPQIISILCSGMATTSDPEEIFNEGFMGIITKPFSISEIENKVKKLLSY